MPFIDCPLSIVDAVSIAIMLSFDSVTNFVIFSASVNFSPNFSLQVFLPKKAIKESFYIYKQERLRSLRLFYFQNTIYPCLPRNYHKSFVRFQKISHKGKRIAKNKKMLNDHKIFQITNFFRKFLKNFHR